MNQTTLPTKDIISLLKLVTIDTTYKVPKEYSKGEFLTSTSTEIFNTSISIKSVYKKQPKKWYLNNLLYSNNYSYSLVQIKVYTVIDGVTSTLYLGVKEEVLDDLSEEVVLCDVVDVPNVVAKGKNTESLKVIFESFVSITGGT